jgi:hypothetical protein
MAPPRNYTAEELRCLLPLFSETPRAWAAISTDDVMRVTGRTRFQLASARMSGTEGLPAFSKGLFRRNRIYYVAGPVLWPDLPLWQACRLGCERLSKRNPDAAPDEVWAEVEGLALMHTWPTPYRPRSARQMLDEVKPLFDASVNNSGCTKS